MMKRRNLLQAMLIAGIAPAIVKSGVLMPVKKIIIPDLVFYNRGLPSWFYQSYMIDQETGRKIILRGAGVDEMDAFKRPRSEKIMLV